MTCEEKLKIICDYKYCIEDEVFKFIEKNKEHCKQDYKHHVIAKDMLMTVWVSKEIEKNLKEQLEHKEENTSDYEAFAHKHYHLTEEQAHKWLKNMKNDDGTNGAHWTIEQTTAVAKQHGIKFEHIRAIDFNLAMNKVYSDNYNTVQMLAKTEEEKLKAYVMLAKDFLFDDDSVEPKAKLFWYYMKISQH